MIWNRGKLVIMFHKSKRDEKKEGNRERIIGCKWTQIAIESGEFVARK